MFVINKLIKIIVDDIRYFVYIYYKCNIIDKIIDYYAIYIIGIINLILVIWINVY